MNNNDVTYVEFYSEKDNVTICLPVLGIKNDSDDLNNNECMASYEALSHFITDNVIRSNFNIVRTSDRY